MTAQKEYMDFYQCKCSILTSEWGGGDCLAFRHREPDWQGEGVVHSLYKFPQRSPQDQPGFSDITSHISTPRQKYVYYNYSV